MPILVLRVVLVGVTVAMTLGPFVIAASSPAAPSAVQRGASVTCGVVLAVVAGLVRTGSTTPPHRLAIDPQPMPDPVSWIESEPPGCEPGGSWTRGDPRELPVGRRDDGQPVTLDAADGIAVIGHGALALAVFTAVVIALERCASDRDDLRLALADDLLPDDALSDHVLPDDVPMDGAPPGDGTALGGGLLPGTVRRAGTGLQGGTAVAVLVDDHGARIASAVLVQDLGSAPRRNRATIDVTRYGCSTRPDPRSADRLRFAPVLPALEPPERS